MIFHLFRRSIPGGPRTIILRSGVAAVELALVSPLLMIIILSVIEFGRAVLVQQILDNGCREGARRAILNNATEAQVTNVVQTYMNGMRISQVRVTIDPSPLSAVSDGQSVKVTALINLDDVSWCVPIFARGLVLQSNCVMRRDKNQW